MNNHLSVIDLRFKEFEELTEAVQGWNIDFRPLSQGDHFSELQQIVTPQLIFTRAHFNNIVDQRGSSAKGFRTFSILADMSRDTFWCHQSVGQQELIIFPSSGEFTAISQTNFNVYAFDIDEQLLVDMAATLYHQDWFSLVNSESRVISCEPTDIEALRLLLKMLSQQGKNFSDTKTGEDSWAQLHFEEQLVEQLLKCILGSSVKPKKVHPSKKALALSRAIEYIETAPQDSITAAQLSKVSGASQRTLEYAFKAHFGLAPKAYIKCTRLHAAHKMLYHAKDAHQQINEIANQQGFWHMGQFAADYKKLFGELPSETYRDRS